ncbi:Transcriptional regulator of a riboflavin/FAD biosynthetic operon [Thermoplasmatales archaeon BRNA1]|nr:Transcriptional regulator of a riboflavin/FAD biosynthetic operon [Thermoplasmatales archaeon BRNA1]
MFKFKIGLYSDVDEKYTFALRKIALLGGIDDYIAVSSRELGDALEMSQQSASKRILELLDLGLIVRDLGARKQRIKMTQSGVDELKREYNEYRRIFELTDHMTVRGAVMDGMGEGGYYICQKGYMDQFESKLGFKPFFGTLNVGVDKEDIGKLDVVKSTAGILIAGFTDEGRSFGDVIAYKAKIRNVECAVVVPARSHYMDVIEIICPYHLRRTLSLNTGDRVDVRINL